MYALHTESSGTPDRLALVEDERLNTFIFVAITQSYKRLGME